MKVLLLLILMVSLLACGPDTSDPRDITVQTIPDPTDTWIPCDHAELSGPTVALQRGRVLETFLAPGTTTRLALDYDVIPHARTQRVILTDEDGETLELIEDRCPQEIQLPSLQGIRTFHVYADDGDDLDIRQGTIHTAGGDLTLNLSLPEVEGDGWFLALEPAHQSLRPLLLNLPEEQTISNLPSLPYQVSLIRDEALLAYTEYGIVYAPRGWSSSWRERASQWYSGFALPGSEEVELTGVALESPLSHEILLPGQPLQVGERTRILTRSNLLEARGEIHAPCRELTIAPMSFADVIVYPNTDDEVVITMGERRTMAPPESCAGVFELPVMVSSLSGTSYFIITVAEEAD